MKILGWLAFLVLIGIGLVIYNLKYLPLREEHFRVTEENKMWQGQVRELQNRINQSDSSQQPVYTKSFLWDELFSDALSFNLTEPAQVILKEIVSRLSETSESDYNFYQRPYRSKGDIIIAGHCDNELVPNELKKSYPTDRDLSFAKAMAVLNFLQSWGVERERLVCIGYGATRPFDSVSTIEGSARNRRVEIIVRQNPTPKEK